MPHYVAVSLASLVVLAVGCVTDHQATRTAQSRRESTIVAKAASDAVRTIQATRTAEANKAACLAYPSKCRDLVWIGRKSLRNARRL